MQLAYRTDQVTLPLTIRADGRGFDPQTPPMIREARP